MGVLIVVENIIGRELAGGDDKTRDVDRAGQRVLVVRNRFLRAAEAEGLAHIETRDIGLGRVEPRFASLAIGIALDADGMAEAGALVELGIEIELAARPR